jgi:hypothetical protein
MAFGEELRLLLNQRRPKMRYIIIDKYTGYIWGDSADYSKGREVDGIEDACRMLDEENGDTGFTYETVDGPCLGDTGYIVYSGGDIVPVVHDGQSKDEIEAVMRCRVIGYVKRRSEGQP